MNYLPHLLICRRVCAELAASLTIIAGYCHPRQLFCQRRLRLRYGHLAQGWRLVRATAIGVDAKLSLGVSNLLYSVAAAAGGNVPGSTCMVGAKCFCAIAFGDVHLSSVWARSLQIKHGRTRGARRLRNRIDGSPKRSNGKPHAANQT